MSYNRLYRGQIMSMQQDLANAPDQKTITVDIYDTESGEAEEPTEIIPLEMADRPFVFSVIDTDEDKFKTGIRSKQLEINIHSSDTIGLETFIHGGDNRFYVEYYLESQIKFKGWLSTADINEDYLPDPNLITLFATDGLGFLREDPLVNDNGVTPVGKYPIIDFVRWCLNGTGIPKHIYVCMNLREATARPLANEGQAPLVSEAIFFAPGSGNKIRVDDTPTNRAFFYIGQVFITEDSGVNTGPFTVTSITTVGTDIDISVAETVAAYAATPPPATFADISPEGHFYKHQKLDARTFEESIGVCEERYTALEKILKPGCFITDFNASWFILNIDELRSGGAHYVTHFDENGDFVENLELSLVKNIGVSEIMSFMDDDCILGGDAAKKTVKTKFNYRYPEEIPCNSDFSRGEGDEPTGAASETIDYELECWEFLSGDTAATLDSDPVVGSIGVLRKKFELGYEKERYLVNKVAGAVRHYFKSKAIAMIEKDKIDISFDYRFDTDTSTVTLSIAHVRLVGDDGFVYDLERTTAGVLSWNQKTFSDPVFDNEWEDDVTGLDNTEWRNISGESPPAPVSGVLHIRLLNAVTPGEKWFSNLRVTHIPFINGSYQEYIAQTHEVTQTISTRAKRTEEVDISDGPNTLIKGVLLKEALGRELFSGNVDFANSPDNIQISGYYANIFRPGMRIRVFGSPLNRGDMTITGVSYGLITGLTTILVDFDATLETGESVVIYELVHVLTEGFYDASLYPSRNYPDNTYVRPYGEHQAFWIFNQQNRTMIKADGNIDGLNMQGDTDDVPDLVHRYQLTDGNPNTTGKTFMLLHFEQDWNLCSWNGFFVEVDDPNILKIYTGHTFKYITE